MANETVPEQSQTKVWTASAQDASSKLKIVKLLELGENDKGRFARVEFDDESSRPLYLLTIADAWHNIFNSLDYSDRWLIRDHFNSRLPKLPQPDGARKRYRVASFATEITSVRGRYISSNYFDLSAYEGVSGEQAGVAVARELLEIYATSNCGYAISLQAMFDDLAAADSDYTKRARRAFLFAVDELLRFSAKHADFHKYLDSRSTHYAEFEKEIADHFASEKAKFVERMRAAKMAKRQGQSNEVPETELKSEAMA
jgi:hypothetical protein